MGSDITAKNFFLCCIAVNLTIEVMNTILLATQQRTKITRLRDVITE
jgi:hypothetical protein